MKKHLPLACLLLLLCGSTSAQTRRLHAGDTLHLPAIRAGIYLPALRGDTLYPYLRYRGDSLVPGQHYRGDLECCGIWEGPDSMRVTGYCMSHAHLLTRFPDTLFRGRPVCLRMHYDYQRGDHLGYMGLILADGSRLTLLLRYVHPPLPGMEPDAPLTPEERFRPESRHHFILPPELRLMLSRTIPGIP